MLESLCTGRFSCRQPNAQSVPEPGDDIRRAVENMVSCGAGRSRVLEFLREELAERRCLGGPGDWLRAQESSWRDEFFPWRLPPPRLTGAPR